MVTRFWVTDRSYGKVLMAQVWIDIEDNDNCGYFPMQTFEVRGVERVAGFAVLNEVSDADGPHEIVGWCDGEPCEVRVVRIGDSGAGESVLIYGGNNGIRLRPAGSDTDWDIGASDQFGEPYMLLADEDGIGFGE